MTQGDKMKGRERPLQDPDDLQDKLDMNDQPVLTPKA